MEDLHQHSLDFGHNLIVCGVSAEWDGFCFDCSLEYLFCKDEPLDLDQRLRVADLLKKCLLDIQQFMNLDLVKCAIIDCVHQCLRSTKVEENAVWILSLFHHLELKGNDVQDKTNKVISEFKSQISSLSSWWIVAMHMKLIRSECASAERLADCAQIVLSIIELDTRKKEISNDVGWSVLKVESITTFAQLLSDRCMWRAFEQEQEQEFTRSQYRWIPIKEAGVFDITAFMISELCTEYKILFGEVNQPDYRADIFLMLCGLMHVDYTFKIHLIEALATSRGKLILQKLVQSALQLCSNSTVATTRDNCMNGLKWVVLLLEQDSSTMKGSHNAHQSTIARYLMAEECTYGNQIFSLWDRAQQKQGNHQQQYQKGQYVGNQETKMHLSCTVVKTNYLLMLCSTERYYHYSLFTARVCTVFWQKLLEILSILFLHRSANDGALIVLGAELKTQQSTAFDDIAWEIQLIISSALQRGASGSAVSSAILSGIIKLVDDLDPIFPFAVVSMMSHTFPLLLYLLQSNILAAPQRVAALRTSQQSISMLLCALRQPRKGAISVICFYERRIALLYCAHCAHYCLSNVSNGNEAAVKITPLHIGGRELISHMCTALSDLLQDFSSNISVSWHRLSPLELGKRTFTAIAHLIHEMSHYELLNELFCKSYDCRSMHTSLAQYAIQSTCRQHKTKIAQLCRDSKPPDDYGEEFSVFDDYAQFIVICGSSKQVNARNHKATRELLIGAMVDAAKQCTVSKSRASNDVAKLPLGMLCSLYLHTCFNARDLITHLRHAEEIAPLVLVDTHAASISPADAEVIMSSLVLCLLPNPELALSAASATIKYLIFLISSAYRTNGQTMPVHLAAVIATYNILIEGSIYNDANESKTKHPASVDDRTQPLLAGCSPTELVQYWIACGENTAAKTSCANISINSVFHDFFAAFMLDQLFHYAINTVSTSTHLPQIISEIAAQMPSHAVVEIIPSLLIITEKLVAVQYEASLCEALILLWESILMTLKLIRTHETSMTVSSANDNTIGNSSNLLLSDMDSVLLILQRAENCAEVAQSASLRELGELKEGYSAHRLNFLLNELRIEQFVRAVVTFVQTTEATQYSTTYEYQHQESNSTCTKENSLIGGLAEYLCRSGWWEFAQKTGAPLRNFCNVLLWYVLSLCVDMHHTSDGETSSPHTVPNAHFGLVQMIKHQISSNRELCSTDDRAFSLMCLAAVLLTYSELQPKTPDEDNDDIDLCTLLNCWLIRTQEKLLASTPIPSLSVHSSFAVSVQEARRCALLYCNMHVVWEQHQQPPQMQPFHSLWLPSATPNMATAPVDQLPLCALSDDYHYSKHCADIFSREHGNGLGVKDEVLKRASQQYVLSTNQLENSTK